MPVLLVLNLNVLLEVDRLLIITNVLTSTVDLLRLIVLSFDHHSSCIDIVLLWATFFFFTIVLVSFLVLLNEWLQTHVLNEVLVGG